jgi:hypothetical protein
LVKLVIINSSAGATDSAVIARMTTIEELGFPFVPGTVTVTVPELSAAFFAAGPFGALGDVGAIGTADPGAAWTVDAATTEDWTDDRTEDWTED